MRNWLQRHDFSYKKPALVPGKVDEELQKRWLVEYEKLKQHLPVNETICFMDGVHLTHNVQSAYGWIKIERLWKWMKERVIYNTYYEGVEEFRSAVFGFFKTLNNLDPESTLGQALRSRVRDKFSTINSPLQASA